MASVFIRVPLWPKFFLAALGAFGALAVSPAWAQDGSSTLADKVKAGLLVEFARYTTWPADRFDGADAPLVMTVLDDERLAEVLIAFVRSGAVRLHGRPVRVLRLPRVDPDDEEQVRSFLKSVEQSHLLYIGQSSARRVRELLRRVEGSTLLTVSTTPRFATEGGMIGLFLQENRYRFDINLNSIERAGLRISSKVLDLARRVIRSDG